MLPGSFRTSSLVLKSKIPSRKTVSSQIETIYDTTIDLDFANIFGRISGTSVMPGDFCSTSVASYEEEVGHIIEDVEKEVRKDYQLLLASTDETSASKYRAVLLLYSEARSELDTVHIKLASDQDEKHQKRTIVNGLAGITNKLTGYDIIIAFLF